MTVSDIVNNSSLNLNGKRVYNRQNINEKQTFVDVRSLRDAVKVDVSMIEGNSLEMVSPSLRNTLAQLPSVGLRQRKNGKLKFNKIDKK